MQRYGKAMRYSARHINVIIDDILNVFNRLVIPSERRYRGRLLNEDVIMQVKDAILFPSIGKTENGEKETSMTRTFDHLSTSFTLSPLRSEFMVLLLTSIVPMP